MAESKAQVGSSPFHTKGLVYQGAKDFYASRVPGGLGAVVALIAPLDLRAFFQQEFIFGARYDILPLIPISEAAARATGISHEELVSENARWVAERDVNGIFKLFLRLTSARMVASMLPKASMQYFNFGTARGSLIGDNQLDAFQTGIPVQLAPWMVWVVRGFAPVPLTLAGARNIAVSQPDRPETEAKVQGYDICKMVWRITWSS